MLRFEWFRRRPLYDKLRTERRRERRRQLIREIERVKFHLKSDGYAKTSDRTVGRWFEAQRFAVDDCAGQPPIWWIEFANR